MCIGIPMQVIEVGVGRARCSSRSGEHTVDTILVGAPECGAWLMVSLGVARAVISEDVARQTADALEALEMAMRGETGFDHLFADLINRAPQLPEALAQKDV
jgi:hydrogenase expression/formation protein HypC